MDNTNKRWLQLYLSDLIVAIVILCLLFVINIPLGREYVVVASIRLPDGSISSHYHQDIAVYGWPYQFYSKIWDHFNEDRVIGSHFNGVALAKDIFIQVPMSCVVLFIFMWLVRRTKEANN